MGVGVGSMRASAKICLSTHLENVGISMVAFVIAPVFVM